MKIFIASLLIIRDLETITQKKLHWGHGFRITLGRLPLKTGDRQRLPDPLTGMHLSLPPTAWEHLSGRNPITNTTHSYSDEKSFIWTTDILYVYMNKSMINKEESAGSARKTVTRKKFGTIQE